MRAAILTTAFVIAALFFWSSSRERERRELAGEPAAPPSPRTALPDVAAGAAVAVDAAGPRSDDGRAPVYEPATAQPAREHVVVAGDSLPGLAARYYGDPARADAIYRANRDRIRDPERLHPGQTLVIP